MIRYDKIIEILQVFLANSKHRLWNGRREGEGEGQAEGGAEGGRKRTPNAAGKFGTSCTVKLARIRRTRESERVWMESTNRQIE